MDYQHYVAKKRAKFQGIGGTFNIPYGTEVEARDNALMYQDKVICVITSKKSHEYFAQNDDGYGLIRGKLTQAIIDLLEKRDVKYQARWDKVWEDAVCQKYKRKEHEDYWFWNHDFYNADLNDLRYIAKLVGVKEVF